MKVEWDLEFISQENYTRHVKEFYKRITEYNSAATIAEFNKNVIDPVKLLFSYYSSGEDREIIIKSEISRQHDKTINNSIGYFHQHIFQYINGWEIPKSGFDIVNRDQHIFVEMKNKHNTMNSSSAARTYSNMQKKILHDDKATCMLVEVIARNSQNVPWAIRLNGEFREHAKIRRVSLDRFYELATGDPFAFRKVLEWLPITLKNLVQEEEFEEEEVDIIDDIKNDDSFFEGLYKLAFGSYQGFEDLEFKGKDELGDDFIS